MRIGSTKIKSVIIGGKRIATGYLDGRKIYEAPSGTSDSSSGGSGDQTRETAD